jgi:putative nucleotidyltransferase with HDIG domain
MAGSPSRKVRFDELQPGMTIREVTELSFDYATLDEKGVKFLKTYFRGASALVDTEQGQRTVPLAQLRARDNLSSIVDVPESLKIAKVVPGTAQFMEKHGLLEFKVSDPPGAPAAKPAPAAAQPDSPTLSPGSDEAKERSKVKVQAVRRFMDTIEHADQGRNKASSVVEEMLDHGRTGDYSSKGVEAAVDEIVQKGSSPAMKAIAGLRGSDQTYAHCTDMSVILADCYTDVLGRMGKDTSAGNRRFVMIAGFMHDIGKSEVPKEILESTVRFAPDSREMQMMRNHTTYGARILSEMGLHAVTINVAHYHHVKRDSTLFTSYPDVKYDEVLPITRLASIVDVYQALIGKRKYKKNWVPGKAVEYIMKLKGSEFDDKMLEHFVESMGIFPVGSLVRLSTNEVAFVLMLAPTQHPDRPIVAVVENASGELLTHHSVLDLMLEPDIRVEEVVDHYEHYNQSEDQAYQIFQSIRVGK